MTGYAGTLLVVLLALDLYMISTSRLGACIRATALQGVVLAVLPLALTGISSSTPTSEVLRLVAVAIATLCVKSGFIPWLMFRTLRGRGESREFEPFVSLHLSQIVNGALFGGAFWIAISLPPAWAHIHTMGLGVGLATLFVGLYMTINRRKEISQVLGFLVLESGVMVIGWALLRQPSFIIEVGALLDVLVAAMVLGILATGLQASPDEAGVGEEGAQA